MDQAIPDNKERVVLLTAQIVLGVEGSEEQIKETIGPNVQTLISEQLWKQYPWVYGVQVFGSDLTLITSAERNEKTL